MAAERTPPRAEPVERSVRPGTSLGNLLKLMSLVPSGGEAKARIEAGEVRVNGQVELRRGRKLQDGDVVELTGRQVRVRVEGEGLSGEGAGAG